MSPNYFGWRLLNVRRNVRLCSRYDDMLSSTLVCGFPLDSDLLSVRQLLHILDFAYCCLCLEVWNRLASTRDDWFCIFGQS